MGKKTKAPPTRSSRTLRNPPPVQEDSDDEPPARNATPTTGRTVTTAADVHHDGNAIIDDDIQTDAAADVDTRTTGLGAGATTGGSGGIPQGRRTGEERQGRFSTIR